MSSFDHINDLPQPIQRMEGRDYSGQTFHQDHLSGRYFVDCNFTGAIFNRCQWQNVHFECCTLDDVQLLGCVLENCIFNDCRFHRATLHQSRLLGLTCLDSEWQQASLSACLIERWTMSNTLLDRVTLAEVQVAYWTAQKMTLDGLVMSGGRIQDVSWHGCSLQDCQWQKVKIVRHVIGNSTLKKCDYRNNSFDTMVWFTCQLDECHLSGLSLVNASFHRSRLTQCQLNHSTLTRALFAETQLKICDFTSALLSGSQFTDAKLSQCDFTLAQLQKASLLRADIEQCGFIKSDLTEADLRGSDLRSTLLDDAIATGIRLHGAQLHPLETTSTTPDLLLGQIDLWYQQHQPGPQHPSSLPILPTGASRYV